MLPVSKTCSTNNNKWRQVAHGSDLNIGGMKAFSTLLFNTVSFHMRIDQTAAEATSTNNYNHLIKKVLTATLLYWQAFEILEQSNDKRNKLPPECYAEQAFDPLKSILEQRLSAI